MRTPRKKISIFIISDSTGATAEMVIHAAVIQFNQLTPVYKRFPFTKTKAQIRAILDQARRVRGIVVYSLVSKELRSWIRRQKQNSGFYAIDLLGPIIDRIQRQWDLVPLLKPGLLRGIEEESLRVAEAVDFTMNHDDGQGVETLGKADIILLGVSRTSKTPTSLYLSCHHGLKVANIPIVPGITVPDKIFILRNQKVGLTIELERLAYLRRKRWRHEVTGYLDVSHIRDELEYSAGIFKRIKGLRVIDVTYFSIEEVAARIMELRGERQAKAA